MIKIVDHKKLDMTDQEYEMFTAICQSYTKPQLKGESLFQDLFETNGEGIITFLKPPTSNASSMEVWLFLVSLMNNQHLRLCHDQIDALCRETKMNIEKLLQEARDAINEIRIQK